VNSFEKEFAAIKKQQAFRHRRTLQGPQKTQVTVDGKQFISFCSNDYLGLANDPRVKQAAKDAIDKYGVGSGASQLISGYSDLHSKLETQLAEFFGFEKAVLFSSGYLANLGVLSTFSNSKTLILEDRLNHASLIDAAGLAKASLKRYRHCDITHANNILDKYGPESLLLVSDGVFSMEGAVAPLKDLVKLKNNYNGMLIIDDAHGIGVLGDAGKGSIEHSEVRPDDIDILVGTFGKAFGTSGAFVCGNKSAIEYLIQKARSLIYTTAPAPALAAASSKSLDIIISEPQRRARLHDNISYLRKQLKDSSLKLEDSISSIQSIILGGNEIALKFSQELERRGLLVVAIRPPTVPANTARLRITLSSEHTHDQLDKLSSALAEIANS
jgi:8-amino-7-oxononanoate synthase